MNLFKIIFLQFLFVLLMYKASQKVGERNKDIFSYDIRMPPLTICEHDLILEIGENLITLINSYGVSFEENFSDIISYKPYFSLKRNVKQYYQGIYIIQLKMEKYEGYISQHEFNVMHSILYELIQTIRSLNLDRSDHTKKEVIHQIKTFVTLLRVRISDEMITEYKIIQRLHRILEMLRDE